MANLTLTRTQTDFFFAATVQRNESGDNGDFWGWLYDCDAISDTEYNNYRTLYIMYVQKYHDGELYGTSPDANVFKVDGISQFPHPKPK